MSQATRKRTQPAERSTLEVLTLAEAANFLRVSQADLRELVETGDLPGRKIKQEWRFHKQALSDWLRRPSPKQRLMRHAGMAKDDPYFEAMLETIYRDRGRPLWS